MRKGILHPSWQGKSNVALISWDFHCSPDISSWPPFYMLELPWERSDELHQQAVHYDSQLATFLPYQILQFQGWFLLSWSLGCTSVSCDRDWAGHILPPGSVKMHLKMGGKCFSLSSLCLLAEANSPLGELFYTGIHAKTRVQRWKATGHQCWEESSRQRGEEIPALKSLPGPRHWHKEEGDNGVL